MLANGSNLVAAFQSGRIAPGGATKTSGELSETEREQWRQQHRVALDSKGQGLLAIPPSYPYWHSKDHWYWTHSLGSIIRYCVACG